MANGINAVNCNIDVREDRMLKFAVRQIPLIVTCADGNTNAYPALFHSAFEIQFISDGECSYFVNDRVCNCARNSVLLIHSNEIHNRLSSECKNLKRFSVIIGNDLIENNRALKDMIASLRDVRQIDLPEKEAILCRIMLEEIMDEMEKRKVFWQDSAISSVIKFLVMLSRNKKCQSQMQNKPNQLITEMVQFLDENATRKISLDELAEQFTTSKYWISRQFHQNTGITIRDYIIQRRVSLAKVFLENTDLKICSVAMNVGFDDLSTFNRDFRIVTGITPSEYRKIFQQMDNQSPDSANSVR